MLGLVQPGERHCQIQAPSGHSEFSAGVWKHSSCGCEAQLCRTEQGLEFSPCGRGWLFLVATSVALPVPSNAPCLGSAPGDAAPGPAYAPSYGKSCPASQSGVLGLLGMVVIHPFGDQPAPSSTWNTWKVSGRSIKAASLIIDCVFPLLWGQLSAELNIYSIGDHLKQRTFSTLTMWKLLCYLSPSSSKFNFFFLLLSWI